VSGPVYVLGTGLSHDGSACLLKDGRICVAIEKERLTRIKHDGHNDTEAIQYCLEAEGIQLRDLTLIVQSALHTMFAHGNEWFEGTRILDPAVPCRTISHHFAHAYGAAATSPFSECTVLVIDGSGSSMDHCIDLDGATIPVAPPPEMRHGYFEKDSCYRYRHGHLEPVYKDFSPWGFDLQGGPLDSMGTLHSIGGLYWAASIYVFGSMSDPGKLMGLAPYGRPAVHDEPIFDLRHGRVFVRRDWMAGFRSPSRAPADFTARFQYFADFARWVQEETQRAVHYVINARLALVPSENLAYCGGVALNAVANGKLLDSTLVRNVYIQPSAGDNGIAIGCAYYGWLRVLEREPVPHDGSVYWGRTYSAGEVSAAICERATELVVEQPEDHVRATARMIADGTIVGWFQGGAEFGPRALGHRSILALPNRLGVKEHINARIKFREDFRPFAPSVPLDDAARFFDIRCESPYMILTAPAREGWRSRLPGVVHVDGSSRVHTVTRELEPAFYELLKAVGELTSVPVLLNTSLNRRGQPIVETPRQAIEFLLSCELDAMVIGNRILRKRVLGRTKRVLRRTKRLFRQAAIQLLGEPSTTGPTSSS
jgi:carbamoyltransferase